MSKILAVLVAGLFASAAAFAQNPAGTSSEQSPILNSKPQDRAETKVDSKAQGMVKKPTGDNANNTEVNPLATGKSASAAEKKQASKTHGMVKKPMGDDAASSELNPVASTKATNASEAKIEARNAKAAAKKQMPAAATSN